MSEEVSEIVSAATLEATYSKYLWKLPLDHTTSNIFV